MKYPNRLSAGANNVVVALSEIEVGKLFTDDTRSDIGSEAEKMKFANAVISSSASITTISGKPKCWLWNASARWASVD
jgi:hypothetical protein